jgi:hypothetical protein
VPGPLVPVHRAQLEQPQRQLPVRPLASAEHQAVHGAVHRLRVVDAVVHLHRRVHGVGVPVEVPGGLEQPLAGEVRRVHELVAAPLVALPAVALHEPPDRGALGVPHRQAAAELLGERQQVELHGEAPVVALLGLLEEAEVVGQRLGRLPGRAVDALEHGALLVAPPVGPGHLHELEGTELGRARDVGTPAEVDELGRVPVDAHDAAGAGLGGILGVAVGLGGALDDLALVRLVREERQRLLGAHLAAGERLAGGHDLAHACLDGGEVVLAERAPARQVEVVVEAVLDRRADGELGAGEQLGHRLRHHVRRGVAEHVASLVGAGRHDGHPGAVGQGAPQIDGLPVHLCGHGVLGQAPSDALRQPLGGGAGRQRALGTVGERDRDVGHSGSEPTGAPWWAPGTFPRRARADLPSNRALPVPPPARPPRRGRRSGSRLHQRQRRREHLHHRSTDHCGRHHGGAHHRRAHHHRGGRPVVGRAGPNVRRRDPRDRRRPAVGVLRAGVRVGARPRLHGGRRGEQGPRYAGGRAGRR